VSEYIIFSCHSLFNQFTVKTSNIIRTPTLDFCHSVKICRPMCNRHPHIGTQQVSTSAKTATSVVIVSCRQEVVWEMALIAGSAL